MALIARFVDTIAASPTTRLDVNDGTTWRLLASSRLDPPRAKRARVSTLLTDGAIYPASAYEDRVLDLQWYLEADSADDMAEQVQLLARELDRPAGNILQYQVDGMTHPVFFKTHRLGFEATDMFTDGTQLNVVASIPAEPFAYGLPQTLSSATVNNNPANTGSNGQYFDVTGILGDVETPLVLRFDHADTVETWTKQSVIATRRWGTPADVPYVLQAESMTQGTDTTVQSNDAVMSGAGSNYSRCTFATTTMATRLSITAHPSSGSTDARGRYRCYLRYRKSVSGDSIDVRLRWGDSNSPVNNTTVTLPSTTNRRWVDLGDMQIPVAVDAPTDLTGAARSVSGGYVAVQAERLSGSGNLDMDVLVFVPCDDRLALVSWYNSTGPTYSWLDGVNDTAYPTNSTGQTSARAPIIVDGGLPMVSPGVTNRIYVLSDVSPSAAQDVIGDTFTIIPSYLPRYLYVRPPAS